MQWTLRVGALALAGLGVGFGLQRLTSSVGTVEEPVDHVAPAEHGENPRRADDEDDGLRALESEQVDRQQIFAQLLTSRHAEAHALAARYLAGASLDETVVLLVELKSAVRGQFYEMTTTMVIARGIELDASGFVERARGALNVLEERNRDRVLGAIFSAIARQNPEAALAASQSEKRSIRWPVIMAISEKDPATAYDLMRKEFPDNDWAIETIEVSMFKELAETDLPRALELAEESSGRALATVLKVWAHKDALAALRWSTTGNAANNGYFASQIMSIAAKAYPNESLDILNSAPLTHSVRVEVKQAWLGEMAASNPQQALEAIRNENSPWVRSQLLETYVGRAEVEAANLVSLVKELQVRPDLNLNDNVNAALTRAINELSEKSPNEALLLALDVYGAQSYQFKQAASDVVKRQAEGTPEEAGDWLFHLPDSVLSESAKADIVQNWARSSPESAATYLLEHDLLARSEKGTDFGKAVASAWAAQDAGAAVEWAKSLPEEYRARILEVTVPAAAWSDPDSAAELIDLLPSAMARQRATATIAGNFTHRDPVGAIGWLAEQPDEVDTKDLLIRASAAAVRANPTAASEAIVALEPGMRRDHAVVGMVDALTSKESVVQDWEAALEWAASIENEEVMQRAVKMIQTRKPSDEGP